MNRRVFLSTATHSAAAALLLTPQRSPLGRRGERLLLPGPSPKGATTLRDPRIIALVSQALEAARRAGATYADVRVTATTTRDYTSDFQGFPDESMVLGFSVRALVKGYWGWVATPYLTTAATTAAATEAVRLAKANAAGLRPHSVDLGTVPVVANGSWTTPIIVDPFDVAVEEVMDWLNGMTKALRDLMRYRGGPFVGDPQGEAGISIGFEKQERVFASTEGSYLTQTIYVTTPKIGNLYRGVDWKLRLPPVQSGWEYLVDLPILDLATRELERIDAGLRHAPLPVLRVDIGRYDIICGPVAMAQLLAATVGEATQLGRALGYETNVEGTSYLGPDPLQYLGTIVASPLVTVTANRSAPKALATVQWDDEGIAPEEFTIIKDGVLVDYQTTREQAAWLAPWYNKQGKAVRSHGCAAAPDALWYTAQHTPNLALLPGSATLDVDEMVAGLSHGLVIDHFETIDMDFQNLNGLASFDGVAAGNIVRNGKRVGRGPQGSATVMFHTPDLWKNVDALGGAASQTTLYPSDSTTGYPMQRTRFSSSTVPALIRNQAIVDPSRRI